MQMGGFVILERDAGMNIQTIAISELKPYNKNAKKHPKEQVQHVANSIEQFGMVQPIVCDKDNYIVIGHCRWQACKKLKMKQVPVLYVEDLTDEQVNALRLADNKTNESDWDLELLADSLAEIGEIDMADFGFDNFEDEEEIVEDAVPVVDETVEPTAKLGDIWQLGRHRLMCGDSTDQETVEKLMNGVKADMLLTDPPYNVALGYDETPEKAKGRNKRSDGLKIENDKMDNGSFRSFLVDAFSAIDAVLKAGGVFYIWHADLEGYNFRCACFDIGWTVRQCLIWNKSAIVMGRQDYQWKHEPCLYGWKEGASHLWASDRKQSTVVNFEKPRRNGEHPTMKPVGLFDYQIKNNTKAEDVVLDTFGGSGTTLIACEQNGRTCRMMELDPKYVDVIVKRWETLTGEKAVLVND